MENIVLIFQSLIDRPIPENLFTYTSNLFSDLLLMFQSVEVEKIDLHWTIFFIKMIILTFSIERRLPKNKNNVAFQTNAESRIRIKDWSGTSVE